LDGEIISRIDIMPLINSKDSKGNYFKWGALGKKYHYKTAKTKASAKAKAMLQGRAIERSKAMRGRGLLDWLAIALNARK